MRPEFYHDYTSREETRLDFPLQNVGLFRLGASLYGLIRVGAPRIFHSCETHGLANIWRDLSDFSSLAKSKRVKKRGRQARALSLLKMSRERSESATNYSSYTWAVFAFDLATPTITSRCILRSIHIRRRTQVVCCKLKRDARNYKTQNARNACRDFCVNIVHVYTQRALWKKKQYLVFVTSWRNDYKIIHKRNHPKKLIFLKVILILMMVEVNNTYRCVKLT